MSFKMNEALRFTVIGVVLFLFAVPVMAVEFPSKPVTLIVPWAPGGATDVTMRVLAETTQKYLGQPVIVENKPGGGGTVGPVTMAATAKPDGYTIAMIPLSIIHYPHMMKASWDPLKDFTYIIHLTGFTFGVVVKADAPWKTWEEFINYSKANPGKVSFSSTGVATTPGLTMQWIARKEGIKWIHVPMASAAEDVAAVLGGHVSASANTTGWAPQVEAGQLRLLVTWGNQRTKRWPHVITLKELGYGIVANSPFGLAGPKGIDPQVVKILHDAFKQGIEEKAYQKILDRFDMEPVYKNSDDYAKYVTELYEESKMMVESLGLKKK